MKKIFLFFLSICLLAVVGKAQPGSIDATFNIGTGFDSAVRALAVQSDGKIAVGGYFTDFNGISRNYIARLNADGSLDATFNPGTGFNNLVFALSVQSDGKIVVGGYFTDFNGISRNYIARLNADGSLDTSFNPGIGFNDFVSVLSVQADGKIVVGGAFTTFNGTARNRIARLNEDGSLDMSFNPGTGFGSEVNALSVQADGKIVVGGSFTTFNGTACSKIARLNTDGTLDTNFNLGTIFNNFISSSALQSDGKIIVVGDFTTTPHRRITRFNENGTVDGTSNAGIGFNDLVFNLKLQSDGKIVAGGFFTTFNGIARSCIVRLNADGSLDTSFNPGIGFDSPVLGLALQSDGKIVVGGFFTTFNGTARNRIARLNSVGAVAPTAVYVSPTGSDTNDGLTAGTAKLTIGAAYALVAEGGTVNIAAGTYTETVSVTKNITFATTGTVAVQNLTMNGAGKTLTLSAPLRVSQVVALQAGTVASGGNLILASSATGTALVDNFTGGYVGTITGNIQAQRYVANANVGYRQLGAPVT